MTKWRKESDSVWYPGSGQNIVSASIKELEQHLFVDVDFQSSVARRICTHQSTDSTVHEMFVTHIAGTVVLPHKRVNGSESYCVLSGNLAVVIFDDSGNFIETVHLEARSSTRKFYLRMEEPMFRGIKCFSNCMFLEVKQGPFVVTDVVWAEWNSADELRQNIEKHAGMNQISAI